MLIIYLLYLHTSTSIYESPEAVNTGNSNLKLKKLLMKCTVTQCVKECTYMYCCEE